MNTGLCYPQVPLPHVKVWSGCSWELAGPRCRNSSCRPTVLVYMVGQVAMFMRNYSHSSSLLFSPPLLYLLSSVRCCQSLPLPLPSSAYRWVISEPLVATLNIQLDVNMHIHTHTQTHPVGGDPSMPTNLMCTMHMHACTVAHTQSELQQHYIVPLSGIR